MTDGLTLPAELLELVRGALDKVGLTRLMSHIKALLAEIAPTTLRTLPADAKAVVEQAFRAGATYDQLVVLLRERGYEISRSALGRWGAEAKTFAQRVKRSREITRAIVEELGTDPENRTARFNIETVQARIMDMISGEEEFTPKELKELTEALRNLSQAAKSDVEMVLKVREESEKRTKAAAVQAVESLAGERGLTSGTIEAIKSKILGVKVAS